MLTFAIEAKHSVDQLHDLLEKCYKEMSLRVQVLETKDMQRMSDAHSIMTSKDTFPKESSTREPQVSFRNAGGALALQDENEATGFLDELKASWVYRRNSAFRSSSFSSDHNSTTSSCISARSMAEISNISVINLAITIDDVLNTQRTFQTWSDEQTVSSQPSQAFPMAPEENLLAAFRFDQSLYIEDDGASVLTAIEDPQCSNPTLRGINATSTSISATKTSGNLVVDGNDSTLVFDTLEVVINDKVPFDIRYRYKKCHKVGCSFA